MPSFKQAQMDTTLGAMTAIADENALYLLAFSDQPTLSGNVERLQRHTRIPVLPGKNTVINSIEKELQQYFDKQLTTFKTPLHFVGTAFQQRVWTELAKIPYGNTLSYAQLATASGNSSAYRAVARANSVNHFAIVIPCHRVIGADGQIRGYNAGVERKEWLLGHEKLLDRHASFGGSR